MLSRKRSLTRSGLRGATTENMLGARTNSSLSLDTAQTGSELGSRSLIHSIPYTSWGSRKVGQVLSLICACKI